jgi:hypothetical protein
MRKTRAIVTVTAGILIAFGTLSGFAQLRGEPVGSRISQAIDETQLLTLAGNTHRLARSQFDAGAAPDSLPLSHIFLTLRRSPEQQSDLDQLLQDQQTPGSANFHQWLTPEQFGERFGPADADIAQLTGWLQSHGFAVDAVHAGKGAIEFSGTAGQVREAFHTSMHKYLVNGQEHWANAGNPRIPAALGPVVSGVVNLDGFFARPQHELSRTTPLASANRPEPAYSIGWYYQALGPADMRVIYNATAALQMGLSGSGATIGVVARSNINAQDVTDFRSIFGLSGGTVQVIVNGTNPGDLGGAEEEEAVLDASWAGAMAPGANIKLVVSATTPTADGTLLSEQYIINNNLADVMTESFGTCEADVTKVYADYLSGLAEQASGEGISYVVATGDSGSSGCDNDGTETVATGPLSVNVLASSPYVTAVGGTEFNPDAGNGPYWSESDLGPYYVSMLKYIPENVWNQSCTASSSNCSGRQPNIAAGDGGASQYFGKPSWQAGVTGIPNDNARDIPDVSLTASSAMLPYLICIHGGCANGVPGFTGIGGTSAATPTFAGILALVRQRTGARLGVVNPILYQMAAAENFANCEASTGASAPAVTCIFNDVTIGNNSVPGGSGYGTTNSYPATVGYDLATGLGSVNAGNLVKEWGAGNGPNVFFSPVSELWGTQTLGTGSAARTLTLINTGNAPLTITNIAIGGTGASSFQQTNNCGSSLSAGASCAINISFTPAALGTISAALEITDNGPASPQSVSLMGTGLGSQISFSTSNIVFASQMVGAASAPRTVTLTNTGNIALSISGIALTGANVAVFTKTTNCASSLNPGAYCLISLTFTPTASQTFAAAVTINDNAPGSPHSISLSGAGLRPTLTISPASLSFGSQSVGLPSNAQSVTVNNTSSVPASIVSTITSGVNANNFKLSNNCGSTISPGVECTISVTFLPSATGNESAALTLTDNATGSPQSVSLSGTGVRPTMALSPNSLSFGSELVGVLSAAQPVTLSNTGSVPMSITSIEATGSGASSFLQSNTCGNVVNAGVQCTITVAFRPAAAGVLSAPLTVISNAGNSPQSVFLGGTGLQRTISLSPASINFGSQALGVSGSSQSVTLTNTSAFSIGITGINFTGNNASQFAMKATTCGSTLNAGANCSITVAFQPTAIDAKIAALTITDNAVNSPQSIALTGTGTGPVAVLNATSMAFGNEAVNSTSSAHTVILTNEGNTPLALASIAINGTGTASFAKTSTCGSTLNASAQCSINIKFSPAAAGSDVALLVITDNAPGSPHTVGLNGTGINVPAVGMAPGSLTFASQAVGATPATQTVTLSNTGTAALSISAVAITGVNPTSFSQSNACAKSLNPGANCTITVAFVPPAPGSKSAALSVTDNAAGSPHSIPLSGLGTGAVAALTPASLAFGNQAVDVTSTPQTITLSNNGNTTLAISSIALTGSNAGLFAQTTTCGNTLGGGSQCAITVKYSPTAAGAATAFLTVTDIAPGSPHSVGLSGTGVNLPAVSLSPGSLTFASQVVGASGAQQTVTLSNTGTAALTISSIAITGTSLTSYTQASPCAKSLNPGATCTIPITFQPSTPGSKAAALTITDNAAGSPHSVSLSGTATGSIATMNAVSVIFGNQAVGSKSSVKTINLLNAGNTALTIAGIGITGANASEFAETSTCGGSLAASTQCTISLSFSPAAIGVAKASVTVTDNAPGSPHSVALTGTGIAP